MKPTHRRYLGPLDDDLMKSLASVGLPSDGKCQWEVLKRVRDAKWAFCNKKARAMLNNKFYCGAHFDLARHEE